MTLEDQVRDTLDDLAARVPPRTGLADVVLREARRRRTRVRLVASGGTAVAVAAGTLFVVADPLALDRPSLGSADPAADETPPPVAPTPVGTVTIDVATLPEGPEPDVEWYANGELRAGGTAVPYDGPQGGVYSIEAVAGGRIALLAVNAERTAVELSLVDATGVRTVLSADGVGGMAASPDGAYLAWAQPGSGPTTLYVTDVSSGEVVHELVRSGADADVGIVKGFLGGDRVLLDSVRSQSSGVWDLDAGTVGPWAGPPGTSAVSPDGALAAAGWEPAVSRGSTSEGSVVIDTATGEQLWTAEGGYVGPRSFSPDSRFVAFRSTSGRAGVTVADARTGDVQVRFEGVDASRVAWEPDGGLVLEVWPSQTSIVVLRCGLDGQCEVAAPLVHMEAIDGSMPYVLGGVL
ncbi:WD40 repeat domain-containing protein [Jiangella mangrovi]|uniref:WD40 repeat domain-containing protein n=1 Tax=Jiangella mangrovi TaxID=1524084 RepID=A0A7W9LNU5_9ACTN|nr:hypothetical protein [Jiangella mangrovi]MBB5790693.1 hypothetical protein [Jiangella mangrovi]